MVDILKDRASALAHTIKDYLIYPSPSWLESLDYLDKGDQRRKQMKGPRFALGQALALIYLLQEGNPPEDIEQIKREIRAAAEGRLTTNVPDATERHTSFIELKCHKCGAIIDAALTQMPRKQLCTKE